eukprot:2377843-Rhodomonas_salina.8
MARETFIAYHIAYAMSVPDIAQKTRQQRSYAQRAMLRQYRTSPSRGLAAMLGKYRTEHEGGVGTYQYVLGEYRPL